MARELATHSRIQQAARELGRGWQTKGQSMEKVVSAFDWSTIVLESGSYTLLVKVDFANPPLWPYG